MSGNRIINKAYIGLGSNIGDRNENLVQAIEMLRQAEGIEVTTVSSYYNTAPVGYTEQPDFLNAVVELNTILSPIDLLQVCRNIEAELKRVRKIRWGPRTIDLDVLLYNDLIMEDDELTIPHPRMHEREFVIGPMNEIAPQVIHPVLGKTIREIFNTLTAQ